MYLYLLSALWLEKYFLYVDAIASDHTGDPRPELAAM
jgi:hypothetical protein